MLFRALSLSLLLCLCLTGTALAGQRLDKIMEQKTLRVATPGDYRPFAMLADGKYEGHDIDVVEKLAKELGLAIVYVPTPWGKIKEDYLADKFDVCIGGVTRTVARVAFGDFLPGYAPFGKVALVQARDKDRFTSPESLNVSGVRVIKNPGGTNEQYVLANLKNADVSTHEKNAEIPGLIAEGKGDVMITETYEAVVYSKKDKRLHAAFLDTPLTPVNYMGFLIQKDDPDFTRVMNFTWDLLAKRGELDKSADAWLK